VPGPKMRTDWERSGLKDCGRKGLCTSVGWGIRHSRGAVPISGSPPYSMIPVQCFMFFPSVAFPPMPISRSAWRPLALLNSQIERHSVEL